MTASLNEFLKLYTFNNNTYDFLEHFQFENQKKFQVEEDALFLLSEGIHKEFQSTCIALSALQQSGFHETVVDIKSEEYNDKLRYSVANWLESKSKIEKNSGFDYYDIAANIIDVVFRPLSAAKDAIINDLALKL